ncbi:glycosyltransferase [Phaeobacter gallaeciensis]|uniref:glycosyltransferase n=1 Tax=Phaeobacter gallaeciensis TaxID=60890 RepID=UPI00237FC9A4|nr:glycosyltransferase [Phaeobacter gallaeciensis]MDE4142385.1 glycosyltransferase [Phaeobacter gallaeciensis]MDE4150830.1 glycosyltransferase [Phaeobacter gallaeciensis]MDE4155059.1 glycosyltransferase [Phaeobacter gallaeciensis]MDE4230449.1 glycosyltransferase [Phaeobacter gallaeciensis]MDE4259526.1 glycosyltransferase [Phaeobacter gallaeciensis]
MKDEAQAATFTTLQALMWPEFGICTERELYVCTEGAVALSDTRHDIHFATGGEASFATWFNLFNLGKWQRECDLSSLVLTLEGAGDFELSVFLAPSNRSWDLVSCEYVTLSEDAAKEGRLRVDLSHLLQQGCAEGVLYFVLRAMGPGRLVGAAWQTQDAPKRQPQLALAVTTFRREAEVARTVKRFAAFRAQSWMKDHVQMIVTDNGRTVDLDPPAGVSIVPNENLGGAGGFTRGLLEARARGASHCLFMDDDASIHMESLERTWMLLAYATDPKTAVAGAMISEQHRWAIWENGALFHTRCLPQHMGTDLRNKSEMIAMENLATRPVPNTFYGGWWYFAFPVDAARHLAFPFFVRGDDVSFSLANDFNILTLNGVVSFQESFTEKESPQTWYLDLRSHMAHHMSLPMLDVGGKGVLKIAAWFFLRNLPRMHYDTLAAINLAVEDVMQGPEFFDQNADMATRRADLKALTGDETWQPLAPHRPLAPVRQKPPSWAARLAMKLTLNGLLIPGFARLGRKITLEAPHRGHIGYVWGASEITVLNADQDKYYTVRHSKGAAWRQIRRFIRNARAFLKDYDRLAASYRERYDDLTSEDFWHSKLGLTPVTKIQQDAAE